MAFDISSLSLHCSSDLPFSVTSYSCDLKYCSCTPPLFLLLTKKQQPYHIHGYRKVRISTLEYAMHEKIMN